MRGIKSGTMRWPCERDTSHTAASSRSVRFVRRLAQAITTRLSTDSTNVVMTWRGSAVSAATAP